MKLTRVKKEKFFKIEIICLSLKRMQILRRRPPRRGGLSYPYMLLAIQLL